LIVLSVARSSGRSFKANKAAIKHVNRQHFVLSDKKERARKSTDSQALNLGRDYCPTSRKIHLILLNSRIFYVV
jgi:uncharacterized C2H2 Zn-finger protein